MAHCKIMYVDDGTVRISIGAYSRGTDDWLNHLREQGLLIDHDAEELMTVQGRELNSNTEHNFLVVPSDVGDLSKEYVSTGVLDKYSFRLGGRTPRVEQTFVLADMIVRGSFDSIGLSSWVVMHRPIHFRGRDYRFVLENRGFSLALGLVNGAQNVAWPREEAYGFVYAVA